MNDSAPSGTGVNGHYNIAFECVGAESGQLAAEKAALIAKQSVDGIDIDINKYVKEIREMNSVNLPGPSATSILSKKGYTLDTVLPEDEILYLDYAANLSKGGTAGDVTDEVHPEIAMMAARRSGWHLCGA